MEMEELMVRFSQHVEDMRGWSVFEGCLIGLGVLMFVLSIWLIWREVHKEKGNEALFLLPLVLLGVVGMTGKMVEADTSYVDNWKDESGVSIVDYKVMESGEGIQADHVLYECSVSVKMVRSDGEVWVCKYEGKEGD